MYSSDRHTGMTKLHYLTMMKTKTKQERTEALWDQCQYGLALRCAVGHSQGATYSRLETEDMMPVSSAQPEDRGSDSTGLRPAR
jgi:hypothetical protein